MKIFVHITVMVISLASVLCGYNLYVTAQSLAEKIRNTQCITLIQEGLSCQD